MSFYLWIRTWCVLEPSIGWCSGSFRWHLDRWTVDVRPWGSMDAGTKHLPWMFLLLPTPCPNLFTTEACCYTHSRKERQYITYLRDHIHTRTIYFLKVNYFETKYTSTLWPNATGMYASLPSRRTEHQDRQTDSALYLTIVMVIINVL